MGPMGRIGPMGRDDSSPYRSHLSHRSHPVLLPVTWLEMNVHRFLIVIENAGQNFSAYSPDLPGCVATGATREETERNMYEAIQLHLDGLREDGLPIPQSSAFAEYVVVGV
jgi:predicted RNase H-like HicB family nuclease